MDARVDEQRLGNTVIDHINSNAYFVVTRASRFSQPAKQHNEHECKYSAK